MKQNQTKPNKLVIDTIPKELKAAIKHPVIIKIINGKKDPKFLTKAWQNLTESIPLGKHTNYAVNTGYCNDINVIDLDKPKNDSEIDGKDWFEENICKLIELRTIYSQTQSGGYHIYYKYDDELMGFIKKKIGDKIIAIDFKTDGGCVFEGNNYTWFNSANKITNMPTKLKHFIHTPVEKIKKEKITPDIKLGFCKSKLGEDSNINVLYNLDISRCSKYDDWIKIAMCLKRSFGNTYKTIFLQWSENSPTFTPNNNNERIWDDLDISNNGLTFGSLIYWLKEDNPDYYKEYFLKKTSKFSDLTHTESLYDYTNYVNKILTIDELFTFFNNTIRNYFNKFYVIKRIVDKKIYFEYSKELPFDIHNPSCFCYNINFGKKDEPEFTNINFYKFIQSNKYLFEVNHVAYKPYNPKTPLKNDPSFINLFSGFGVNYNQSLIVDNSKFSKIINHIKTILCNNDLVLFEYFINYLSHIIQFPYIKSRIALVFISLKQQAGKNIFFDWFGRELIGNNYLYLSEMELLFQKFNAHLSNKLFTVLDEIQNKGLAINSNDKLKSKITCEKIQVEKKGFEIVQMDDFQNFIFLSNNLHCVKAEAGDRRYCVFDVSNEKVGDFNYFNEILVEIKNDDCKLHFFHYLLNKDLSNFNILKLPNTKIKNEITSLSIPNHISFIEDLVSDFGDDDILIPSTELYKMYKIFTETNFPKSFIISMTKFSLDIKKFGIERIKTSENNKFRINKNNILQLFKTYHNDDTYQFDI